VAARRRPGIGTPIAPRALHSAAPDPQGGSPWERRPARSTDPQYPETYGDLLDWAVRRVEDPDHRVFLRISEEGVTYAQFRNRVDQVSNLLTRVGVQKVDPAACTCLFPGNRPSGCGRRALGSATGAGAEGGIGTLGTTSVTPRREGPDSRFSFGFGGIDRLRAQAVVVAVDSGSRVVV
jgi:hypothetical protein